MFRKNRKSQLVSANNPIISESQVLKEDTRSLTPFSSKTSNDVERKVKTKEELAQLRKQMMKRSHLSEKMSAASPAQNKSDMQVSSKKAEHNPQNVNLKLLERLASGKKQPVDRKEMKKLT